MSYALSILSDQPDCIYMLDDTAPFQDYSQNGRAGTFVGTEPKSHLSLVRGGKYAKVFDSTSVGTFDSKSFLSDDQAFAFSLEAWVRLASIDTSNQQILGNDNNYDGLTINGTVVSFTTKYQDGTASTVSHNIQTNRRVHLVGIHTETKNSLYVDGELVAEANISPVQRSIKLAGISNNLFCGQSAGSQKIAVAGIATYTQALSPDSILRHYMDGHNEVTSEELTLMHDGLSAPTSLDRLELVVEQYWDTEEEWLQGDLENVSIESNVLVPEFDGEFSLAGAWTEGFALSQTSAETIHGVLVFWDGRGVLMEYSLDGEDWYTLERNMPVGILMPGTEIESTVITIRATFTEGLTADEQYLRSVRLAAIYSNESLNEYGLKVVFNDSYPRNFDVPATLSDSWGIISGTPTATLMVDDEWSEPIETLEMWVRRLDDTAITWTGTRYINGVQTATIPPPGEWFHLVLIPTTPVSDSFNLGANIQVGGISGYERVLTASEVSSIYSMYSGTNILTVSENSGLTITESATPAGIYATDWALQA